MAAHLKIACMRLTGTRTTKRLPPVFMSIFQAIPLVQVGQRNFQPTTRGILMLPKLLSQHIIACIEIQNCSMEIKIFLFLAVRLLQVIICTHWGQTRIYTQNWERLRRPWGPTSKPDARSVNFKCKLAEGNGGALLIRVHPNIVGRVHMHRWVRDDWLQILANCLLCQSPLLSALLYL